VRNFCAPVMLRSVATYSGVNSEDMVGPYSFSAKSKRRLSFLSRLLVD
jgi:hypothetical protein